MGQRLLLVDNDRSFLKEHQVSLEAAFDLEVAASPDGVVTRLESGAFAAVVICVEVADNKGYALCSTIRKNPKLNGLKVALISAKAEEEEYRRHQSLKWRADLYLHKPIAPSALVAALTPLVPGRALDPDNPFGELVDSELGDDWLDGLKSSLEAPAEPPPPPAPPGRAPVFGIRIPAPAPVPRPEAKPADTSAPVPSPAPRLEAKATAPPDTSRVRLLEEQVTALHEELRAKDQRLRAAEAEAQEVHRQLNSVTLNLDELERSNRESEALKARLAETEAALRALEESRGREGDTAETLKAQLREALAERTELIQQVETLNRQVGEKAQRAIELLKERDRLMHENLDLESLRAKAQELEAVLEGRRAEAAAKQQEWEAALAAKAEELSAKQRELEAAKEAQDQLNATIEGLVERHTSLEGLHQAALLEAANHKEKARSFQVEIAGLEATMRGQGRDLGELGARLRQVEAELTASQSQVLERDQQLLARQETLQRLEDEVARLTAQAVGLRQELDEARIQHDGERLELMNGLDHKEAELIRLKQTMEAQQEANTALEREKQAVHGQLSEHRDRLQNLDALLQEIQDKLRRSSDLARG